MNLSLIVAMARNRVIGLNNQIPWHLPSDLKRFKKLTMGHHVIMGRRTYESIGRQLPGRTNIIVSGRKYSENVVEQILDAIKEDNESFVIGGESIYKTFLPHVTRMYITEIATEIYGDVFFPEINLNEWSRIQYHTCKYPNELEYTFSIWNRIS